MIFVLNVAGGYPPTAAFTYVINYMSVAFTDTSTSSDATIVSWLWDFGDGSTSTLQNPTHLYTVDDTYTVTLTVTDDKDMTSVVSHQFDTVLPINTDGPGPYQIPLSLNEWLQMEDTLGVPVPSYYLRGQETSGDLQDDVQGVHDMADAAAPLYRQTLTDWTLKWLKTAETSTEGFFASAGELWNTNVQSVVAMFYFRAVAAGGLRVIYMMSGANAYVSLNGSGILQLRNSGTTTGSYNYFDGEEHFCAIEYICGAGILGHSGAGLWRLSTDKERLTGTWEAVPDDVKGIGGCGTFTPPECYYGPQEAWSGTDAETLSTLGIKTMMQGRGWTVTGY
jgi:hypothetical protein